MSTWWEGPLIGFDVETTGVDVFTDRIVTAAIVSVLPDRRPFTHSWLINPGVPIPDEAAAIHGVTNERASTGADPAQALYEMTGRLGLMLHQAIPVVAFNAAFDFSMLEAENARHRVTTLAERLAPKPLMPIIDPFVIDRGVDPYRKGSRRLDATCQHYHVTLAGAHTADADALAAVRLAQAIGRSRAEVAIPLDQLQAAQIDWHRERQESFAQYLRRQGKDASEVSGEWPLRTTPAYIQGAIA